MPSDGTRLLLHEEIMLLALRDEKGTIASGTWHKFALGAALLSELTLGRRIVITDDRRQLLELINTEAVGDPIVDHCLSMIAEAKRRASVQRWLHRLANIKRLTHWVASRLCEKGVLRVDERRIMLVFRRTLYPELNPLPERRLLRRLETAILDSQARVTARTAVLIAIADPTGLLKANLDRKRLRASRRRIQAIAEGHAVGRAAAKVVASAQAAAAAAIIAASVASTG
jgi:hypothetical protein